MPDYGLITDAAQAAAPQFFALTTELFGFIPERYGQRLHAQRVEAIDYVPDAHAEVLYYNSYTRGPHKASAKVVVRIEWSFHIAVISVGFFELRKPGLFSDYKDAAGFVSLDTLAELAGQQDDPAFLLGDLDLIGGRLIAKRANIVQTNLRGLLEGLATATERYGADLLRGDTAIMPEAIRFATEKRKKLGYWS